MNGRAILHCDMDAFFASVEQRDRPELRGRPVVVGAGPHERGVVAAASYEARRFGVHSALPSRTAYKLCPQAVFVRPDMAKYKAVSRQVMALMERFTPIIEPVSVDEAFLDVTGCVTSFEQAAGIARALKERIRQETGLTASVGVAPNKFLAKLASDLDKPDGLTVIGEPDKLAVLAPLPVGRLWGVGKVTEQRLHALGLRRIGDLQARPVQELRELLGNQADHLHALACGEDDRPVQTASATKSISSEFTFAQDTADLVQVKRCLLEQCEEVGARLRQEQLAARTVQLKLRWADFTTLTRHKTLEQPTQDEMELYAVAGQLLAAERIAGKPIRLIGVGGSNLVPPAVQGDLFDRRAEKRARVNTALDQLRRQLGPNAIKRGSALEL